MLDWFVRRLYPTRKQDKHLAEQFSKMAQPIGEVKRIAPEVEYVPFLAHELRRQNCKVYQFR